MIGFNRFSRRRLSLLASGSFAALVMFGAATQPAQAQTCPGDYCSGTYAEITYNNMGFLFLVAAQNLNVTTGGLFVSGTPGSYTGLYSDSATSALGIRINNTTGAGLEFINPDGTIDIGLYRFSTANGPLQITGTTSGVRLNGGGWFWTTDQVDATLWAGTVTASNGAGIDASFNSTMDMQLSATVSGTTGAIKTSGSSNLILANHTAGILDGALMLNNTGGVSFSNRGVWNAEGASTFAGSSDVMTSTGTIAVSGAASISGLETWNNNGDILFGANSGFTATDGVADDRLTLGSGTTFNGLSDSRLVMDVNLSGGGQADCSAAVAADCLDLAGATVTGTTPVLLNSLAGPASLSSIVLIDGAEGAEADSFILSSESAGYANLGAGVIQRGLFDYAFTYDAEAGQYALVPHANASLHGFARAGGMASSIWDATAGHFHNRQADLRDSLAELSGGSHPGFWVKAVGNDVERTAALRDTVGGQPVVYDASYMQETRGFVAGLDLVSVQGEDRAFVVGLTAGKVKSDVDFKASATAPSLEGTTYGAYASYLAGPVFLDGLVGVNDLDADYDLGGGLAPFSSVKTIGAQLEGGYRIEINEGAAFLEPIATLVYTKTDLGEVELSDVMTADFGEPTSLRGALGLRLGGTMDTSAAVLGLAITGRVWEEFSGDHGLVLTSPGEELVLEDETGTLGDVGIQLTLAAPSRRLSAFADYGFKFREGYSDSTASLGVRFSF